MKNTWKVLLSVVALLALLLAGCTPTPSTEQNPTATEAIQPTDTLAPTQTIEPTATLEPTPLPGEVILPLESLQYGIPWLPLDKAKMPMVVYYGFNVTQPPFNVPEVRQAFAMALDSDALTVIYQTSGFYNNEAAARTVIPSGTLSRNVSGAIGLPYDPVQARALLAAAGYSDPAAFPATKLLITYPKFADYPGIMANAATEAVRMWQENLGVTVTLDVVGVEGERTAEAA